MPHALEIAGMVCPNNVFLAPMAGYTNLPFRQMCEELGAGLTFTEMVSAKGLHYGSEETKLLLLHGTSSLVAEGSVCPPPASGVERRTMLNSPVGCERAAIGALADATGVAAVPATATGVGEGVRPNAKPQISIDDFAKVELKVGEVVACEKVVKSEKLLHETVKIGEEIRSIVSGIAKFYTPEEMVGKKVVVVTNLKPAKLCGVLSEGMILCAEDGAGRLSLVSPERLVLSGATVR